MLGPEVAKELRGCKWVGLPFAGGMAELAHIKASTIVVSDLHRHVINLARCIKDDGLRATLATRVSDQAFHDDELADAQNLCRRCQPGEMPDVEMAVAYFTTCWMGRSHKSGIDDEFNGKLSIRWNANGGDSNKRYRSAVASLEAWGEIMRRCNFAVMDVFAFLERCEDSAGHGIYCDPPFPGPGDRYKHHFSEEQHRRLSLRLVEFNKTRVVCRFYDHPLIRELYPPTFWRWRLLEGRTQANSKSPEVLLISTEEPT
jgi:site-specific DNA-adenine methylase